MTNSDQSTSLDSLSLTAPRNLGQPKKMSIAGLISTQSNLASGTTTRPEMNAPMTAAGTGPQTMSAGGSKRRTSGSSGGLLDRKKQMVFPTLRFAGENCHRARSLPHCEDTFDRNSGRETSEIDRFSVVNYDSEENPDSNDNSEESSHSDYDPDPSSDSGSGHTFASGLQSERSGPREQVCLAGSRGR